MPRILTVDDSNTIRSIITKQMTELGFEVEQAEDGAQGLAKLDEISVDLVLLDVTMPVMDGPTMLATLRERGNKTPVIMLTSESKRAIIANAVKSGIEDYILKPFKPEELKAKVLKVLRPEPGSPAAAPAPMPSIDPMPPPVAAPAPGGRQFIDVLVVDDMETVHKKLRALLPEHVTLNGCVSAREALQLCRERVYRIVIIDMVIPDVNSVALMNQIRALQPHAIMVALALRTANDIVSEVKTQGFQDALCKPFEPEALDDFLSKHLDVKEVLTVDGNVLACASFVGKEDKLERYFSRLKSLCIESLEKLASACYESTILDLGQVPIRNDKVVRLVVDTEKQAKKLGLSLALVGNAEIRKMMSMVTETASLRCYDSVREAREAEG